MTDPEAPLYGYNEQYFVLNPKYTKEELFAIQAKILVLISEGSEDIEKDLNSKIDQKVIRSILMQFWRRELIKKERLGVETIDGKRKPTHRYYTSKNERTLL